MCGCTVKPKIGMKNGRKKVRKKVRKFNVSGNVTDLVKQVAVGLTGFGASNFITAKLAEATIRANPNSNIFTPLVLGVSKIALGGLTLYLAKDSKVNTKQLLQSFAGGMAFSGGIDLAKQYLPAPVKQAAGLAGTRINGVYHLGGNNRIQSAATQRTTQRRATVLNQRFGFAAA